MIVKRLFLLLVCLLFMTGGIYSDNTNYFFWTMDIDKGLSHSNVTSILSDSKGMLWVGTAFGLNCYDRYELKNYFHREEDSTSIPSDYIFFVTEAPLNTIWASTANGLVWYDKSEDKFVSPYKERITAYSFHSSDKEIWFGGEKKLYRCDYHNQETKELPLKLKDPHIPFRIIRIFHWKKDVLLLITRDSGIWEYDCRNGELQPSVYSLPSDITAAHMDKQGTLYLSIYRQGLFIFDRSGKLNHHLTTNNSGLTYNLILDITEKDGQLWLATDGGGINIVNLKHSPFTFSTILHTPGDVNSLPANSIGCLYKDKQQNIWIGSIRAGVSEIKETFIRTYTEVISGNTNGLTNKTVSCLCEDEQGLLWVGTDGGGINRFDPMHQTFKHFPSTGSEKVVSIVEYSPSELLISLYNNGIYLFNKTTGKYIPFTITDKQINNSEYFSGYLNRIYQISDEKYLFLGQTAYIYHKPTRKFTALKTKERPDLLSSLVLVSADSDIAYLQQGSYLLKADLQTDSLSIFFTNNDRETIQVIERDADGIFWIGTNRGLRRFDPVTKKYEKIPNNLFERVSTIVAENGTIWIGAKSGLFSYNVKNRKFAIWQESDGYLPNELSNIYHVSSSDPYIYIGGNHGMIQIKKSINSGNTSVPEIQLTDVVLNGLSHWNQLEENSHASQKLSIPWNYKSLRVKINSLEQDIFKKRLFRYTIFKYNIHGGESKVKETYDPTLTLDLLSPGEYSIQVCCYTDNGDWSTPQQLLLLVVTPPWYKDHRILLPVGIVLLLLLVWQFIAILRRREEKIKWKMSEIVQQTNQEKIQFLINISHELRTPLTLIFAPLKKLIEKAETESITPEEWKNIRTKLTSIHKSANHMKDIINMTLDVNRISDEENVLHKRPHALNEWIYSVAEEFKYEFETKQITLVYALNEHIGTVEFDDHKCESVLSNMLMNALKFAPEKSRITLTSAPTDKGVRIGISDQGKGIEDMDPQKLFTRFYQGEHNQGGSGIGLSYAKILIKKHGGDIGAFNNPDSGATFYFELPITDASPLDLLSLVDNKLRPETSDISFPSPGEELVTAEKFPLTNFSVIIVEDNDELRHYLIDSLREEFRTVYQAPNGQKAWTMITERMPDIVISDIMMPFMDGYELCRKIKEEDLTSHIPVVLLTARVDTDSTATGYKLGADAYIPKPFELDTLVVRLRNLLRNREMMKLKYRETILKLTKEENVTVQATSNTDDEFMLRFNKLVIEHLSSKELSVQFLTEQMGMSRSPLYAKLKALTNMGVNDYINNLRIEKASDLLIRFPNLTIADISDQVGFEYQRYFSTLFKQIKGMTPTQFRVLQRKSARFSTLQDNTGQ